jgi:hypothetical protein
MLITVQLNEGQMAAELIRLFSTQPDIDAEKLCELTKKMVDWCVALVQNMIGLGMNFAPKSQGNSASAAAPGPAAVFGAVNSAIEAIWMGVKVGIAHEKMDAQAKWGEAIKADVDGDLRVDQTYTDGICGASGGEMKNENFERSSQMLNYTQHIFNGMRKAVENEMTAIIKGDLPGRQPSKLKYYMGNPDLFEVYHGLADDYTSSTAYVPMLQKEMMDN